MYSLQGNYVDLVIIVILVYFISEAWRYGFWVLLADFLSFFLALLVSLRAYTLGARFLESNFSLPHSVANALGFMLIATVVEALLSFTFSKVLKKIPYKFWKKPWNNIAGIIPSTGRGLVLISFLLTLIIGLPINPRFKTDITESKIGNYLVEKTSGLESSLSGIFGGLAEDSLTYLTTREGGDQTVALNVKVENLVVDEESETQMIELVNDERKKRGLDKLTLRPELVPIARDRARKMWEEGYFGHVGPDGKDASDHLSDHGVSYFVVGENLALAPTLKTAHIGLMNSEGHRANILSLDYKRIGIGVVENGYYGKIFVQIFTD